MSAYSSPLSFSRSTAAVVGWGHGAAGGRHWAVGIAVWTAVAVATMAAWFAVATWYLLIFTAFGLWVIPYRLIRRGQRRRKDVARVVTGRD